MIGRCLSQEEISDKLNFSFTKWQACSLKAVKGGKLTRRWTGTPVLSWRPGSLVLWALPEGDGKDLTEASWLDGHSASGAVSWWQGWYRGYTASERLCLQKRHNTCIQGWWDSIPANHLKMVGGNKWFVLFICKFFICLKSFKIMGGNNFF